MMNMRIQCILVAFGVSLFANCTLAADSTRTLIIFFDGLRPDYITPDLMPNLYRFSLTASQGMSHHSIYPTVTRVNATSYSTGCYPYKHGILGNTIHFPELKNGKVYNTGNANDLMEADSLLGHRMVASVSLGQILKKAGRQMMVFSSGSTGQAYLQDHTRSGWMINTDLIMPESIREQVYREVGPVPASHSPNTLRHQWITNALIRYGLAPNGPVVSAIWYSDPDGAAHSNGIGSEMAVRSLKAVDESFGRILSYLDSSALRPYCNIIISTDHGFVTHMGKESLSSFLVRKGYKKTPESDDVIVAGGAIYLSRPDTAQIRRIVEELQRSPSYGAIFTCPRIPGSDIGVVPGTLSFASIHWDHPGRTPDILVDVNWSDSANTHGYKGTSTSQGVAGHGSLSPYETRIRLLVDGPGFKSGISSQAPTSNIDIAPTVLGLHHLPVPKDMDGRMITELMNPTYRALTGNRSPRIERDVIHVSSKTGNSVYTLKLHRIRYDGKTYVDHAETLRDGK